ncbi:MAG: hypothetical protein IKY98_05945 [Alphaproteobacteria bacterium]|nr:hypothetical protein [Alphaproteobacteria bacterium]
MRQEKKISEKQSNLPIENFSNTVENINIQHMTGADKNIENYERMVGNLFVGQTMTPQKVATHIGGIPVMNSQNIRK